MSKKRSNLKYITNRKRVLTKKGGGVREDARAAFYSIGKPIYNSRKKTKAQDGLKNAAKKLTKIKEQLKKKKVEEELANQKATEAKESEAAFTKELAEKLETEKTKVPPETVTEAAKAAFKLAGRALWNTSERKKKQIAKKVKTTENTAQEKKNIVILAQLELNKAENEVQKAENEIKRVEKEVKEVKDGKFEERKNQVTLKKNNVKNTSTKTKKNTLTKEKQDKITKLKEHIDYCKDLEKSYKEKHIEVQRLTTYLKDLSSKTPNEPISKSDVIKIIDKIGEIPDFNTNTKKTELDRLKGIQNKWKGEVEGMKNNIDKKIAILKTEPEEKHKEIIKPFGIP
jgi:hypothetical protein